MRRVNYDVVLRFTGVYEPSEDDAEMRRLAEIVVEKLKGAPFEVALHDIRELEKA